MTVLKRVLLAVLFFLMPQLSVQSQDAGELPRQEGRALNFDFETGDLRDWRIEGEAFRDQPIEGDTVVLRRGDMRSQHQGRYWIGGFEKGGDRPRGKLISVPFSVTHPYASFLVGGGNHVDTCVELVDADRNEVIFRVSGLEEENLQRVVVDLRKHAGKKIFIQVVDNQTGHWGHVNFDDFRFHAKEPGFPARKSSQLQPDVYQFAGLPPEKSAEVMTVPEGFSVTLFAGEPDVRQPIAFCQDDRGRLWVAEAYGYPRRQPEGQGKDRILIFEDTNNDGKYDKRTVFLEKLNLVSGLELGYGGLWVGAAPYLLFIPIDSSNDKPAGEPKVLLDGWGYQDTHETLNTFCWGPDGWLYGCHGVFTHSKVGKPGTPDPERVKINAGIWRYHPTKHRFEVFAEGTSNPWGLDYNEDGQFFIEACVIPHCFHIIQGARYLRQAGQHFNPYTYADIGTIADHLHYLGANPHGGNNKSDSAGGGHAHCGLMVYEGGTWPKEYHGQLFLGNIHGRRINMDRLKRKGSGYVASHGPDFLLANDAWARFINLQYGPDGNVYLIDWYDQQACHRNEPEVWDRSNGRIYKISHRNTSGKQTDLQKLGGDLSKLDDKQLQALLQHENQWYVRHARRLLSERQQTSAQESTYRNSWPVAWPMRSERSEYERAWEVQLALEDKQASDETLEHLERLARTDPSPVVRLYIASALQRIPPSQRWAILEELLQHEEDRDDHNLPLMYWYAAEPLAQVDAGKALQLAMKSKVPMLDFMVRRIAAIDQAQALEQLIVTLGLTSDVAKQKVILQGLLRSLQGRRQLTAPASWPTVQQLLLSSSDASLKLDTLKLGTFFGDEQHIRELVHLVQQGKLAEGQRQASLQALLATRHPEVGKLLLSLLQEESLRTAALRGLAAYERAETPQTLLALYSKLTASQKRDAVGTLAARPAWARELLLAVQGKTIPLADVPADVVRQLRQFQDEKINAMIGQIWGVIRSTPAERQKVIASVKKMITSSTEADIHLGRALYEKTCAQCHVLFGAGGKVGPDITGSNRTDLDYLLENIYDPNAVIPREYAATFFVTQDGRSLTGIVKERNNKTITIQTANEVITLPVEDIEEEKPSEVSMMPEDQLKPFSEYQIRSLMAYLQSPTQVPLLATEDNAAHFFNGKDLSGWSGDAKLWKVENGEIIGKSPGIKKNEFLKSDMVVTDFRLSVKVQLKPNRENSGIQFRSEVLPDGDVKGYQADIGAGWWGKLYEEHGRGLLTKENRDAFVKREEWNDYVIEAKGPRIRTWINGNVCVDLEDPDGAKKGIVAFQIHSGGPMEIRFKEIKLEVLK